MARETRQRKGAGTSRTLVTAKSSGTAKAAAGRRPPAAGARPAAKRAAKPVARGESAKPPKPPVKNAAKAPAKPPVKPVAKTKGSAARPARAPEPPPAAAPAPAPRKPGYYEALAMYENGVRALQRHDYPGAATQFRTIMERYPEERELQERSHLYLRVCERETARRPATPQTPQERVYAATVALNAGDTAAALDHLSRALTDAPESDHAHYIMSVALASKGDSARALEHLRQAITFNPENRALARQDPDLEPLRHSEDFRDLTEGTGSGRSKARKRR
jgi:tetratricopeptide (TPR) repeat protein